MANIKLATAGDDIKLWDTTNYTLHHEYSPHNSTVADISWSYDGQFLASASLNGDKIVVAYAKKDIFSLAELAANVEQNCVCFSRTTSRHLLASGKSGDVNFWDLKLHQLKKTYQGHQYPVTKVQFNWNDTVLLSGNSRGDIILHNVTTGSASSPLRPPKIQAIRDLKFSTTRRSLFASASDDGVINLWDANARHLIHPFKEAHGAPATGLAFSPVNEMLLTSVGLDKRIVCYDVKAKTAVKSLSGDQPFTSIDFFQDGVTLAAGTTRGKVFIYDLRQTATPVRSFVAHKTSVQCLAFRLNKLPTSSSSSTTTNSTSTHKHHGSSNNTRSASLSPKRLLSKNQQAVSASALPVAVANTPTTAASLIPQLTNKPMIKKCLGGDVTSAVVANGTNAPATPSCDSVSLGDATVLELSRSRNMSDDIFSPLHGDDSSLEKPTPTFRKQPIGAGSSKLFFGDRPITAGLEECEMFTLNGSMNDSRQMSPTPAPRRRSASFSPRTSRNLSQEHKASFHGSGFLALTQNVVSSMTGLASDLPPHSPTSKLPIALSCLKKDSVHSPTGNSASSSSLPEVLPSTIGSPPSAQLPILPVLSTSNDSGMAGAAAAFVGCDESMVRRIVEDAVEDLQEAVHTDMMALRVVMLKEFQIQKAEIELLLQRYSVNEDLLTEIERLREENRKLQSRF